MTPFLIVTPSHPFTATPLNPPVPRSRNPFRSIVIPEAPTTTPPDPGQYRLPAKNAFVATTCPHDVIGVPPPPVASGAITTTSTSAITAAKLLRSLIAYLPRPPVNRIRAGRHGSLGRRLAASSSDNE